MMVCEAGFEPAAPCFRSRYSDQAELLADDGREEGLEPPVMPASKAGDLAAGLLPDGVLDRARTGDLHVRSVMRFLLRHEHVLIGVPDRI